MTKVQGIEVDYGKLVDALKRCKPFTKTCTLPILRNVHLRSVGGRLLVHATDLDSMIQVPIVLAEGYGDFAPDSSDATCVDIAALNSALQFFKGGAGTLRLFVEGRSLKISNRAGLVSEVQTFAHEEYPRLWEHPPRTLDLGFSPKAFVDAIARALLSCSTDDTRPALNAVLLRRGRDNRFDIVGTDGHTLTHEIFECSIPLMNPYPFPEGGVLLAPAILRRLDARLIDGSLAFSDDGKHTFIHTKDGGWVAFRNVEGPYPKFEQVVPSDDSIKLRLAFAVLPIRDAAEACLAYYKALGRDYYGKFQVRMRIPLGPDAKHEITVQATGSNSAGVKAPTLTIPFTVEGGGSLWPLLPTPEIKPDETPKAFKKRFTATCLDRIEVGVDAALLFRMLSFAPPMGTVTFGFQSNIAISAMKITYTPDCYGILMPLRLSD